MSKYRQTGFDFSNEIRNNFLAGKGLKPPKATSTGTTIVGCLFKDGVILGSDTRSTNGDIVAEKNCEKIHYVSESIRCGGAGTAADTDHSTALISSNLEMLSLQSGRKPRVVAAMTLLKQMLFRYQGHIGASLILGGVDSTGPHLFNIHSHGSTDKLPYVTDGSGSYAAMSIFEIGWKPNMEREEALNLVMDAVRAGIFNDLGSGSNVDACIITAEHTEMLRNIEMPNEREPKERNYKFRRGTTACKKENVRKLIVDEQIKGTGDEMDTS